MSRKRLPFGHIPKALALRGTPTGETFHGWEVRRDDRGDSDVFTATHPDSDNAIFTMVKWCGKPCLSEAEAMRMLTAMAKHTS